VSEEKTIEHRLTELETTLKDICENHLPHLQHGIDVVRNWVLGIFASVILTVIGLVVHHILTNPGTSAKLALMAFRWIP